MPNTQSQHKLLGLEWIRFIAAFAILIWHYQHFAFVGYQPVDFVKEQQPFYSLFKPLYDYGGLGVQLFWCISGFIFFWKYREPICQKTVDGKAFFILRFSRLYPLHFITLVAMAGLQISYFQGHGAFFVDANNDWQHFIPQLFLASNWGGQGYSFNAPIWSISIEVLVYCFFFLVLRVFGGTTWITLTVLGICAWIKVHDLTQSLIVNCVVYFYLGGLTVDIFHKLNKTPWQKWALVFCFLVILTPWVEQVESFFNQHREIWMMLYFPFVVYFFATPFRLNQSMDRSIQTLGNLTYASYLIHFPLQLLIVLFFGLLRIEIPFYDPKFFILFMGSALFLSYLVYQCYEKPWQDRIRQIRFSKSSNP